MKLMCLLVPAFINVVSRFVLVPPPPPPSHLLNYQIVVVDADRAYLAEVLIPVRKLDEIQLSSTQCLMTIRHRYTT